MSPKPIAQAKPKAKAAGKKQPKKGSLAAKVLEGVWMACLSFATVLFLGLETFRETGFAWLGLSCYIVLHKTQRKRLVTLSAFRPSKIQMSSGGFAILTVSLTRQSLGKPGLQDVQVFCCCRLWGSHSAEIFCLVGLQLKCSIPQLHIAQAVGVQRHAFRATERYIEPWRRQSNVWNTCGSSSKYCSRRSGEPTSLN